jgi:hypothetical protein
MEPAPFVLNTSNAEVVTIRLLFTTGINASSVTMAA